MAGGERPPSVLNIEDSFMGLVMSKGSKNEIVLTKIIVNVKVLVGAWQRTYSRRIIEGRQHHWQS
jgi:hypothetical protein